MACVDPEGIVSGGPTLTTFLEEEGSKYHNKWAIISPSAKRHLNGVSLADR